MVFINNLPVLEERFFETSPDLLFGQLESPLSTPSSDPANPDIPHKYLWRHSHPEMVKGLEAAGFAAVSCASNVTYGSEAILNSLSTLDSAGIGHCGAGRNLEESRRPALIERGGVRFGFLSYTSVFWPVGHAAGPDAAGVTTIKAATAYQPGPRALEMPGAPPLIVTTPDQAELEAMADRAKVDLSDLEVAFAEHAASYGGRRGISYSAWREVGVSAATLKKAGIRRSS